MVNCIKLLNATTRHINSKFLQIGSYEMLTVHGLGVNVAFITQHAGDTTGRASFIMT